MGPKSPDRPPRIQMMQVKDHAATFCAISCFTTVYVEGKAYRSPENSQQAFIFPPLPTQPDTPPPPSLPPPYHAAQGQGHVHDDSVPEAAHSHRYVGEQDDEEAACFLGEGSASHDADGDVFGALLELIEQA